MVTSLHVGWRHVLFANCAVDPELLDAHLPSALMIDTCDGDTWLSVVPFTNADVRPTWVPDGWGFPLPELNPRTYLAHDDHDGVYFFSLDAQGIPGVVSARLFHHLPNYYARCSLTEADGGNRLRSRRLHPGSRPVHFEATYGPTGTLLDVQSGSLGEVLTERYRYYTEAQDGSLRYAALDHEPWPLYESTPTIETNTLFEANGFTHPGTDPVHYYSPGVTTIASSNRRA